MSSIYERGEFLLDEIGRLFESQLSREPDWLKVGPAFNSIHSDLRFSNLRRGTGLEDAVAIELASSVFASEQLRGWGLLFSRAPEPRSPDVLIESAPTSR